MASKPTKAKSSKRAAAKPTKPAKPAKPVKSAKAKPEAKRPAPKPAKPAVKKPESATAAKPAKPTPDRSPRRAALPSVEQAKRAAEHMVGGLMRALLSARRAHYRDVFAIEKKYYRQDLWEESRKTYERYLEAEEKERILKIESLAATDVAVLTSGEGMGKNRYTCSLDHGGWRIAAIDVLCEDCSGTGSCRWCEGKGCLDCQQSGRCVSCSGGGWTKWAK